MLREWQPRRIRRRPQGHVYDTVSSAVRFYRSTTETGMKTKPSSQIETRYQCIMKERPASEGRGCYEAPPPLRCAVQGFAPLRRR
jgi:hypothetical protein